MSIPAVIQKTIDAIEAFAAPNGNMPAWTGGFNDLKACLPELQASLAESTWQPIETAPKDNKHLLLLARFSDDGTLQDIDHGGVWESDRESYEMPEVYWFWASCSGRVEEPSHWMYQPEWYARIEMPEKKSAE